MNKISCEVCLDLMPLVNDDIASEDSKDAVNNHIKTCESCRMFYASNPFREIKMDDSKVVSKMKNELYFIALIVIIFGAMLGVALTDGMGMFYNILIMPTIGVIGYFTLSKKSYLVPLTLFGFMYVFMLIKYTTEGMFSEGPSIHAFLIPGYWAFIYSGLCLLGIIIGFLLKIAFGKRDEDEKTN